MKTKVVFVALYDNSHGRYVLQGLIDAGMIPCAVFVGSTRSTMRYRYRSIVRYFRKKGLKETIDRLFYRAFAHRDVLCRSAEALPPDLCTQAQRHGIPLIRFDNINHVRTRQIMRHYEPDFLVLGGAPLLKRNLLDLPRYGVINAHPAKLPEVRGMDVVGWSILEGVPIGLTVFFVDEGVDTGPILSFHEVSNGLGLSLEQIEQKLQSQAGIATVKAIQGFLSGELCPQLQGKQDGKLYRALPKATRKEVNHFLQQRESDRHVFQKYGKKSR